jgi:hypothetical protein
MFQSQLIQNKKSIMKSLLKLSFLPLLLAMVFTACNKVDKLPIYGPGTPTTLSVSSTAISPDAGDSNKVVLTYSWTNPNYATDSSKQKFIVEIDSAGRNFSKEITRTVVGKLNLSLTGNQLDSILAAFGFTPGQTFSYDLRVTSSYGNNNEQLKSNLITVKITSFLVPITLTPSSGNPVVLQVSNATSQAIGFTWNASPYGASTINYALQFDAVGGNFANPQVIKYGSSLNSSILVNDLNNAAIAAGVLGGSTKGMEFRIVSYLEPITPLRWFILIRLI